MLRGVIGKGDLCLHLFNIFMMGMAEELESAQLEVVRGLFVWALMYADDIMLMADSGMELQTMLEVVQVYVMRWRMKFNNRKSKIMVVGKREGGMSWKIGEEIMEEIEEFKDLGVLFDRKLQGNVILEKMANKADEWVGKVMVDVQSEWTSGS